MNKFINYSEFMHYLMDDEKKADKGGEIVKAILAAKSPRLTNIAEQMDGQSESNYKAIHRFIKQVDVKAALMRLYQEEAGYVIGDPTEMPRYKAPANRVRGYLERWSNPRLLAAGLVDTLSGTGDPLSFHHLFFENDWRTGDFAQSGTHPLFCGRQGTLGR